MALEPGGIIAWIVVRLTAGWITGKAVRGGGTASSATSSWASSGAFIGGFVMNLFGVQAKLASWAAS